MRSSVLSAERVALAAVVVVVTSGGLVHLPAAVAHGLCVLKAVVLVVAANSLLTARAVAVADVLAAERMPAICTAHFRSFCLFVLCLVLNKN